MRTSATIVLLGASLVSYSAGTSSDGPSEPVSVDKTICVMPVDPAQSGFIEMKDPKFYWKCTDSSCVLESKVMPSGLTGYRCNCGHGSIIRPVWVD